MDRKEIIFFDELGFGWVVDHTVMEKIHSNHAEQDAMVEKTLADLLRRV